MTTGIVVLDGFTLNPGDLSWEPLHALGDVTIYDRTAHDTKSVVERTHNARVVLTNKVPISKDVILGSRELRYIGILATGTNVVDLATAHERKIVVTNVPSYSTEAVAQLVFAYMLDAATQLPAQVDAVRQGRWQAAPDFTFSVAPMQELAGKTLGIVGLGEIGSRVAEIGLAFQMNVIAAESMRLGGTSNATAELTPAGSLTEVSRVPRVPFQHLLASADFVTLHRPLHANSQNLMGVNEFRQMKPDAVLINTARGGLLDEAALLRALNEGWLRAAYLDVLINEPPRSGSPLLGHPRCRVTPHVGWTSQEARGRLLERAAENVRAFLAGKPIRVVNLV